MFSPPLKVKSATRASVAHRDLPPCQTGEVFGAGVSNQSMQRFLAQSATGLQNHPDSPEDLSEREAERTGEQLAREPSASVSTALAAAQPQISGHVGSKGAGIGRRHLTEEALRSPGRPLDRATRGYFERRFARDFSGVRIHTDDRARRSVEDMGALAYTFGRHIAFGSGQFAPETPRGRRLLAHELTHVVQQERTVPVLQRAPDRTKPDVGTGDRKPGKKPDEAAPELREFVQSDLVQSLTRGKGDDWEMTIEGFVDEEKVARLIWPKWKPTYVKVELKVAVIDPVYLGRFELDGVDFETLKFMEPSFAKLFVERGLEDESKESAEVLEARAQFRKRHRDLGEWILRTVDFALKRAARRNPDLLIAYYRYYAAHDLDDEEESLAGGTVSGETWINSDVLRLESKFKTSDPVSLLAGTLMHEFVHTPQGGADTVVGMAPKEAKAYGIEVFFSERMDDTAREEVIYKRYRTNDPVTLRTRSKEIFLESYYIMTQLYKIIDQGGPAAAEARKMSVEFISKNESDYGTNLKEFIAKHRK